MCVAYVQSITISGDRIICFGLQSGKEVTACIDNKLTNNLALIIPIKSAVLFCYIKNKGTIKESMIILWQIRVVWHKKVSEKKRNVIQKRP